MAKKGKPSNTGWATTENRYLAFIDVLGFKDMVARESHEEIHNTMIKINEAKKRSEEINWVSQDEQFIKSTFFSDSIVLYSKDDSKDSALAILYTVSVFTNDLITQGIPHKGAVAFGKMTLDETNSIVFGQPLIDAYLLQDELLMYSIVVHPSAEEKIIEFDEHYIIFEYACPFKGGTAKHLTVPPFHAAHLFDGSNEDLIDNTKEYKYFLDGFGSIRYKTAGHLRRYVDNTNLYITKLRERLA